MAPDSNDLQRRQFLVSAMSGVGAAVVAKSAFAGYDDNPNFVSLGDAHKGTLEIDLKIMNQFGSQPQDVLDFYTACRKAMTAKNAAQEVSKVCRKFKRLTIGGPMLGDIRSDSVSVWMHLPDPDEVKVTLTSKIDGNVKTFRPEMQARIQTVRCDGLSPDTKYSYTVSSSKDVLLGEGAFTTIPTEITEEPFRIAFGADFHKIGMYRPELMRLIQERGNRAMMLIGDSAVDGRKDDYGMINVDYLLRNLSPPLQQLTAHVPTSATWDDHDYWGNDTSGTSTNSKKPIDVVGLRQTWKSQWNNPDRDLDRRGIYFDTQIGPIHYIALDTRSCRLNKRRGKRGCFLGEEQMSWLKERIAASTAPFILISGGTMWTDHISAGKDSWGTWDKEGREQIFEWLDQKKTSQVMLLSGDRHGARGFGIPRANANDIYEFEIGTLGGVPGPGAFAKDQTNQLFGLESRSWAFGEFTFQQQAGKPVAEFRLINELGNVLETVTLSAPSA